MKTHKYVAGLMFADRIAEPVGLAATIDLCTRS